MSAEQERPLTRSETAEVITVTMAAILAPLEARLARLEAAGPPDQPPPTLNVQSQEPNPPTREALLKMTRPLEGDGGVKAGRITLPNGDGELLYLWSGDDGLPTLRLLRRHGNTVTYVPQEDTE